MGSLVKCCKSVVKHMEREAFEGTDGLLRFLEVLRSSPLQQLPIPDSFSRIWSAGAECEGETRNPPQKDCDAVSAGSSTVSGHQTEVPGMHEQGPPPGRQRLLRWDVVLMSPVLFHQLLQKWMYLPKLPWISSNMR